MRAPGHRPSVELAELLMGAANALAAPDPYPRLSPIGLPVRRGRLALGRQRAALGPGACAEVEVVAGFATAAWIGRPGMRPPELGRMTWTSRAPLDARGRVVLDRRARAYLAVGDAASFDVAVLTAPGGGLLLVPVEDFERRVAGVGL